ncbi:MAG TPA: hypothetical protein VND65_18965 [Candidatus Binatia bacterium]|nr:hypothetical protein [Candidatus Binatia bacterium]
MMIASLGVAFYAEAQTNSVVDAQSDPCSSLGRYIFVGGTGGFDALGHPELFESLLQTGHVGLYEHASAVAAAEGAPDAIREIENAFAGTGGGQAELGQEGWNYFTLPPSYGFYTDVYLGHGLHPGEANVNTPQDWAPRDILKKAVEAWREYVNAARTAGIDTVAPIVGPNAAFEPKQGDNVFATNPFYALERDQALYGKAIAFDVPPNFFLTGGSGPGYQKFIVQAIQWGNENGLRTTVLLSPFPWPTNAEGQPVYFRQFAGNTFSSDTEKFVKILTEANAVPSEWAVDNYEDPYAEDAPAMVPETEANTTTAVGWWLARNAPVNVNGVVCPAPGSN